MRVQHYATHGQSHTMVEDAYALAIGCVLLVLGLVFLQGAGLVTGGMAGVALLIGHSVPLPTGLILVAINMPFFVFAYYVMGGPFAVKAMLVNGGIGIFSTIARLSIHIGTINPVFAAVVGGTVIGLGILILTRHHAGVGGIGVLTFWLQRTRGWHPGRSQTILDVAVVAAAIPVVTGAKLGLSMLSVLATSLILMAWHRPDRYIVQKRSAYSE